MPISERLLFEGISKLNMSVTGYFVILMFAVFGITNASHFRGAFFSWAPLEDGATIKIKFRISWRRTYPSYWCNDTDISTGSLIGSGDMTCYSGCSGTVGSLKYHCTDYSIDDDWSSGRNEVIYKVPAKSFSFRFSGSAWIDTLQVGAGGSWSLLATVDMSVRSDTGRINSSPTVEMTPILNLQDGCQYKIYLQVGDVDGDIVRCRRAKGEIECDDVCNSLSDAALDEGACSITYNPNGNQGLYAVALQIEDFASNISTTPLSSVPLQFIMKVNSGNSCDDIPEFIQPTPDDGSCFALEVGDTINVTVKARGSKIFKTITTISPIGMVESSQKKWQGSTWHYIEMNVTWTPTENDAGQDHTLCFYATISTGVTNQIRCINLPVSVSGPTPLRVERVGFTNTWTIIIDQMFAKPTEAAYIKVYESSTNKELISVDASTSSDVVFDPNNRQINVSFHYDFDMDEDYHVTIPSGLVEGFVSCGALSIAVNDSEFWKIEVDCGKVTILNGDVNAPNGTDYPHSVFYDCKSGYYLVGVSKRTCTANGIWTDNDPSCNVKDCGNFSIPDNGYVSTNSTIYNTTVDFYCNEGYKISGNSSMFCEDTGLWSTSPPVCTLIDCKHPGILDNGYVSTPNGTAFGMTAYYSCDLGYDLIGGSERQCQQDKQWSGAIPLCSPKDCGLLLTPVDGTININKTTVGNTITYECDVGFLLRGDSLRECLHTGLWSGSDPICELADCGQLQSPLNGNVNVNGSSYKSVGIFSCDQGYNLAGNNISECLENGSWSSQEHFCKIVADSFKIYFTDCGPLSNPANGSVSSAATVFGSVATYSCKSGFEIICGSTITCQTNGSWGGKQPTCQIKDCGIPSPPENGNVLFNDTTYGSKCFFSCYPGYDLKGVNVSLCSEDGSWNSSQTECIIKDCGNLTEPYNGLVDVNDTTYGSTAIFSCKLGHSLQGYSNTTCTETGMWDNDYPKCITNDCGNLTSPNNGTVLYSTTTYLSTAVYRCNTGYTLVGMNVTECTAFGIWSSTLPTCQIVDCGPLHVPKHGRISSTVTTFGQKVNLTCDIGYDLIGDRQRTCLVTGLWSGTEIVCKIKDCGMLSDIEKGSIYIPFTTYGSVASYKCDRGYRVVGDVTRVCKADGNWDGIDPSCELIVCPEMSPPVNGHIEYNSTLFESELIYSCNSGYMLFGEAEVICQKDGTWSSYGQNCTIKDCGYPTAPMNGEVQVNETVYRAKADYVCHTGFELVGNKTVTCGENEAWSETGQNCTLKDCGVPLPPQNGNISYVNTTYGSVARYFCFTGYDITGGVFVSCGADGFWNITGQDCIKKGTSAVIIYGIIGGVTGFLVLVTVSVTAVKILRDRRKNTSARIQEQINLSTLREKF